MSTPSALTHALGVLKLVRLHVDHPSVVSARTLQAAADEAIERLNAANPHRDDLGRLYAELVRVTPRGHIPYVTLTQDTTVPYGAVITDAAGSVITRQLAKSIDGLVQLIRTRFEQLPERHA
ncbi:hypothetical protein [Pseudomonas sp. LRF_L74]|uniref:hypothetical protein n=1 Tax=Pseudomonas sp. LRF_L74 TaxID=3369422 RepID=UPI003F5E4251